MWGGIASRGPVCKSAFLSGSRSSGVNVGPMGPADLARAIAVAATAHSDQVDKSGQPYILHPIRVMLACADQSFDTRIAAVLHDVVEDTWVTFELLQQMNFSSEVIDGVDALTRRDGEDYFDYIERCTLDPIGAAVKLADLADNSDPLRACEGFECALARYNKARSIIERALNGNQTPTL